MGLPILPKATDVVQLSNHTDHVNGQPQGELAGRKVTNFKADESPLPPELTALISSYIPDSEIHRLNGLAGGQLAEIPALLRLRAESEASLQTHLAITDQNITTAMLQAIGRDFPILFDLNVAGSTLNGPDDFGAADIKALLPNCPFLNISGVATLDERMSRIFEKMSLYNGLIEQGKLAQALSRDTSGEVQSFIDVGQAEYQRLAERYNALSGEKLSSVMLTIMHNMSVN